MLTSLKTDMNNNKKLLIDKCSSYFKKSDCFREVIEYNKEYDLINKRAKRVVVLFLILFFLGWFHFYGFFSKIDGHSVFSSLGLSGIISCCFSVTVMSALGEFIKCISLQDTTKMENKEDFEERLKIKFKGNMILNKEDLTFHLTHLKNYFNEELEDIILKIKTEDEQIGRYSLIIKLYDELLKDLDEKNSARRKKEEVRKQIK